MKTLSEFEKITSAEDFFDFFDIEYDEYILRTKKYLIIKLFANLIKDASEFDEDKKLSFYRFALLRAYGDFVNGVNPSVADIWSIYEGGGCSCTTSTCATTSNCSSTPSDA
ncbi:MAG: hypothetical protein RL154_1399 [Pseudomonadota bacterium]|jgi:nitrogenase-stabilizing/protective protein